jgi:hypothetical protein
MISATFKSIFFVPECTWWSAVCCIDTLLLTWAWRADLSPFTAWKQWMYLTPSYQPLVPSKEEFSLVAAFSLRRPLASTSNPLKYKSRSKMTTTSQLWNETLEKQVAFKIKFDFHWSKTHPTWDVWTILRQRLKHVTPTCRCNQTDQPTKNIPICVSTFKKVSFESHRPLLQPRR